MKQATKPLEPNSFYFFAIKQISFVALRKLSFRRKQRFLHKNCGISQQIAPIADCQSENIFPMNSEITIKRLENNPTNCNPRETFLIFII